MLIGILMILAVILILFGFKEESEESKDEVKRRK